MALTDNGTTARGSAQGSSAWRSKLLDLDLDDSYTNPGGGVTGGYDLSAVIPNTTLILSDVIPHYDGAARRWFDVVQDGTTEGLLRLRCRADTNSAPGAEVADDTDLSGHTGLVLGLIVE